VAMVTAIETHTGDDSTLQAGVKALKDGRDLAAMIVAARDMRDLGEKAAQQCHVLLTPLDSASLSLRAMVLEAFAKTGIPSEGMERVKAIVLDTREDLHLRKLALLALGAPVNRKGKNVDFLVQQLANEDRDVAYYGAIALTNRLSNKLSPHSPEFENLVAALSDVLAGEDTRQKRFALFALARLGTSLGQARVVAEDAAAPLRARVQGLLSHTDPSIRVNSLEALSRIWPEDAMSLIRPLLDDECAKIARAAASAICFLQKDEAARDALLDKFRKRTAWRESADKREVPALAPEELARYEAGGPLAGLRLPLFPTHHGEPAGHPGGSAGAPELKLHENSVEHWRAYWFKYCKVRSFYDQQSLIKNWTAPGIPSAGPTPNEMYAEPIYCVPQHATPYKTGDLAPSVPVIRCKINQPVFELEMGELEPGLYTVRVIAAVPEDNPRVFMKPLFFGMTINDGKEGRQHTYRIRCGYVDQFYGIAELYFHVFQRRVCKARLYVADGSEIEPLVHNIELHDALAGATKTAIKRRSTTVQAPEKVNYSSKYLTEERIARDADIWRGFPPLNKQFGHYRSMLSATHYQSPKDVVRPGHDGLSLDEIQSRYGKWVWARGQYPVFMVNQQMGLVYTYADLEAGRPLPDPYPYKDDGAGLYQADPEHSDKGMVLIPVAEQVSENIRYYGIIDTRKECDQWVYEGNIDAARDEAMRLIRIALQVPAYESSHSLNNLTTNPGVYGRDPGIRRRQTQPDGTWLSHYPNYRQPVLYYDKIFTYIDGNEELAESVGRFVPWVETSLDVVKLLDAYLTQTVAKRTLRYQYYTSNSALAIADLALVMDNKTVTAPWIEWLFSKTFIYPLPVEGIQNLGITSSGRSGCTYIGSSFYAGGEGAASRARNVEQYLKYGLFPEKYDLRRSDAYPKAAAHIDWHLDIIAGGHDFLRIGDVTGAERNAQTTFRGLLQYAPYGWKWYKKPEYAWIIKHAVGRTRESDSQWREIEKAAGLVTRAPWLDLPSRQVYNWAGLLESGLQHDDYRFRNTVYVRTGLGHGHAHADALDLQVVSHGLPMTVDGGQRPGYSTPADGARYVHNTVIVDEASNHLQSWVRTIADGPGAKYMEVEGAHDIASVFRRQVALIDVDSGTGSKKLPPDLQQFDATLPTDGIAPANSYVVDVFRVDGGSRHTYGFHGPVSGEVVINADNLKEVRFPENMETADFEQTLLRRFRKSPFHTAGDAQDSTVAVWRYAREGVGAESLHGNFDPRSPRKFLKLTLFNTKGMRVLHAQAVTHARNYKLDHVFTQRRSTDGKPIATVFVAIVEPYAGQPFVQSQRLLTVADNGQGANRAVALEIVTRNGHRDIVFMDGEPEKTRHFEDVRVASEYAFYSTDDRGLRLAEIHGGTCLNTPELRIDVAQRVYHGNVVSVDYLKKQIAIDAAWPEALGGQIMQVAAPGRRTSYTVKAIESDHGTSLVTVDQGAKFYRSQIETIDGQTVKCRLTVPLGHKKGLDRGFTVANDQRTRFWHADYLGGSSWKLQGEPVIPADFAEDHSLTVYEYGPGDRVEINTQISVTRTHDDVFAISCNTPCTISFRSKQVEISSDRRSWASGGKTVDDTWTAINCKPARGPIYVRLASQTR